MGSSWTGTQLSARPGCLSQSIYSVEDGDLNSGVEEEAEDGAYDGCVESPRENSCFLFLEPQVIEEEFGGWAPCE